MTDISVELTPTVWVVPGKGQRWDLKGSCQGCGATYSASGTREFVDEFVADFQERHEGH